MDRLIYCVEDDENIRELLNFALTSFQFQVKTFPMAEEMFAETTRPSLILLDVMLPGMSGLDALRAIRGLPFWKTVPVILLTAKTAELDKVHGLNLGADDYLGKPFSLLELHARIEAVLRRTEDPSPAVLRYKGLVLDTGRHTAKLDGQPLSLTAKEFALLQLFLSQPEKVIEREELFRRIWGYHYQGETRTLDMHILALRKKLRDNPDNPTYIKTVRGIGYTLAP